MGIDLLTRTELQALASPANGPCISVFLPTHRRGAEVGQDPIRLKNLLAEAETQLIDGGVRAPQARALLQPGRDLIEDAMFWRHQADGLAVFLTREFHRRWRLPLAVPELVVVAPRFHLKPLLPILSADGRFFVLALSQNRTQLYEGTRDTIRTVDVEGLPASLAEALRFDDPEKQLQFHTGPPQAGGRRAAIFHGHGVGSDDADSNLLRYCQQIDAAVGRLLAEERDPLVLAGVADLLGTYRQANGYAHLAAETIPGNPDAAPPDDLRAKAYRIVAPRFRRAREEAAERFAALAGTPLGTTSLEQIVLASRDGRVEVLFVAVGVQAWGRVDLHARTVGRDAAPTLENEDLLDASAVQTMRHGGTVYADPPAGVPGGGVIAAILRY